MAKYPVHTVHNQTLNSTVNVTGQGNLQYVNDWEMLSN